MKGLLTFSFFLLCVVVFFFGVRGRRTIEIGADLLRRQGVLNRRLRFHDMVAMKIMASQTALPLVRGDECLVRGVQRVVLKCRLLVTIAAIGTVFERDPLPGMFAMARDAQLWLDSLSGLGESWLEETEYGMSVIGSFMTCEAGRVSDVLVTKRNVGFPLTEQISNVRLQLLA